MAPAITGIRIPAQHNRICDPVAPSLPKALITGVCDASNRGHLNMWSGAIVNVTYAQRLPFRGLPRTAADLPDAAYLTYVAADKADNEARAASLVLVEKPCR